MDTPQQQALRRLVADGTLTEDQARAVARELSAHPPAAGPVTASDPVTRPRDRPAWTALLAEVGGYVGAAFVVAATVVLVGDAWNDLSLLQRVGVLAGPGVLLLAAAAAVLARTPGGWPVRHRRGTGPRRRLAAALVVTGGGLVAGAVVAATEQSDLGYLAIYYGTGFVVTALGYAVLRTSLLHVAAAGCLAVLAPAVTDLLAPDGPTASSFAVGLPVLGVGLVWAALALRGVLAESALGLTVAGVLGFVGSELLTDADRFEWVGYACLAALAAGGLAGYVRTRHTGVLVVGVTALATVVPQAVTHYTDGVLGVSGVLLVTGVSILGASVLGLRLRSESTPGAAAGQPPTGQPPTGQPPTGQSPAEDPPAIGADRP